MSLCLHEMEPFILKACLRPCPFIYKPVCATDGANIENFSNDCLLEMENCFSNDSNFSIFIKMYMFDLSFVEWKAIDDSECEKD